MTRRVIVATLLLARAALASGQQIQIEPASSLADEPVVVRISQLRPNAPVIVRALASDADGKIWASWAGFHADREGVVDLSKVAPRHGTYQGTNGMGLIQSLDVAGDGHGRSRFTGRGWQHPWTVTFSAEVDGRVVASAEHQRVFGRDVEFSEVRTDTLRGSVFVPDREGQFPGVLLLSGSEGGLGSGEVAAVLASRGYVSFNLAYCGADGLPAALEEIPLEYFERAAAWLRAHPRVRERSVAIVGTSKGAEAALLVASTMKELRAVVAYAPSSVVWSCICTAEGRSSWSRNGSPVPFVPASSDPTYRPPAGFPLAPAVHYAFRLAHAPDLKAVEIPVELVDAPVLLISGSDDLMWPSRQMAEMLVERRNRLRPGSPIEHVVYPGAGHLIGKVFLPAGSTLVGSGRLQTGGTPQGNAAAQQASWPRVLEFLANAFAR